MKESKDFDRKRFLLAWTTPHHLSRIRRGGLPAVRRRESGTFCPWSNSFHDVTAMSERVNFVTRGKKRPREQAPQDMRQCATGSYLWGTKLAVFVDILVLGQSLEEHGNKARRVLSVKATHDSQRLRR